MALGARTVLISRWRTGGQSSFDLVREFLQELPHVSAGAAWQRSVSLLRESQLDLAREPRVHESGKTDVLKGEHPFFWAGYILADTGSAPPSDKPQPQAKVDPLPPKPAPPAPGEKAAPLEPPPKVVPPKPAPPAVDLPQNKKPAAAAPVDKAAL